MEKYVKCFTKSDADVLTGLGYEFLYEKNDVYWFENNKEVSACFSNSKAMTNLTFSDTLNL